MPKEKKFAISKRAYALFIGIGLTLISIILAINVGYVARALAFPFLSLFGIESYIIYLLIFVEGFCFIFKDRQLRVKRKIRIPAFIFAFVGLSILLTLILRNGQPALILGNPEDDKSINFFKAYQDVFKNINGGYFTKSFLDIFNANRFAGGFLGYFLSACLGFFGNTLAYVFASIIFVFGIFLFFLPDIIKVVKNQMAKQGVPVKEDTEVKEKPKAVKSVKVEEKKKPQVKKPTVSRLQNVDVISNASSLPDDNSDDRNKNSYDAFQKNNQFILNQGYDNSQFYQANGTLVPARFRTSLDPAEREPVVQKSNPQVNEQPERQSVVVEPQFSANPVVQNDDMFMEQPKVEQQSAVTHNKPQNSQVEKKTEQLDLFGEKQAYDESAVTAPHIYSEPVAIDKERAPTIIQPAQERLKFVPPSLDLLSEYKVDEEKAEENKYVAEQRQIVINDTFSNFGVGARCVSFTIGPAVTRFNIEYDSNVSVSQVKRIISDLAIRLGGVGARFEQIVAGERYSGLEVPNATTSPVSFKEIISSLGAVEKHPLAVGFGKNISGKIISGDFNEFPHMLLAGTTGSGKSIYIHSIIMTLIMRNSPDDLKLILIDPKQVEMNMYEGVPHLATQIIGTAEKAKAVMNKLCDEMERRNSLFKEIRVTQIKNYNEWAINNEKERLPYIVVVFDEYADCHDVCKDIEVPIRRLAQKARSTGIHLLIATQRPSTDVVTGVLKGNLPTHVALMTANVTDSTVILGESGAENLLGKGDMLVQSPIVSRTGCVRVQSPYVADNEINAVVDYLTKNYPAKYDSRYETIEEEAQNVAKSFYSNGAAAVPQMGAATNLEDELYNAVKEWAMGQDYVSMSRIQRDFSMGFNRAGRLFKRLQEEGIVASKPDTASSAKGCRVLVKDSFHSNNNEVESEEIVDTSDDDNGES